MRKNVLHALMFLIILPFQANAQNLNYPSARKTDQKDTYFDTEVKDPYRWMEDDQSKETAEWVKEENELTFDYLGKIPFQEKIKQRMTTLWNFEKQSTPFKTGNHYYFFKNDGIQNQSVLYIIDKWGNKPYVILDQNKLSDDGTSSVTVTSGSKDGKLLGYAVSKKGSDWNEIYVKDISTGEDLQDHLNWIKFSGITWYKNGFYYNRYNEPSKGTELTAGNTGQKLFYHTIGQSQEKDQLIFQDSLHPKRNFGAEISNDERWLFLGSSVSTSGNDLRIKDLLKPDGDFVEVVSGYDYNFNVVGSIGDMIFVHTNFNAPRYKLICINMKRPQKQYWRDIIPETNDVLRGVLFSGAKFIGNYMKDASSHLRIFGFSGGFENEIKLPSLGTVDGLNGYMNDSLVFYSVTTFTLPSAVYKYNLKTRESSVFFQPKMDFNSDDYVTNQVFYESKDKTKIPMFLVYKKGLKNDGNNPTLLFGYGGFNISKTPEFKIERLVFLENGGIFAMPCLRGGGEYGEDWHKAGTKEHKQNVFDDFIAAAEYLIKEKYTSSEKLAINGRSNGGLLVGATMTQRPELFKVALPAVGVMDMLRYHKFTIGAAWAVDYGTSENAEEFKTLYAYSPLHNIKKGVKYPATLITTADHDDRVVPAHSFKFASTLQENNAGNNPILIRIDTAAGHGAGKPTSKLIEEQADIFSFLFYNLGMNLK